MKRPSKPAAVSSSPPRRVSTDFYPGEPPHGDTATFPRTPEPTTKAQAKRELEAVRQQMAKGHVGWEDYSDQMIRGWKARYGEGD